MGVSYRYVNLNHSKLIDVDVIIQPRKWKSKLTHSLLQRWLVSYLCLCVCACVRACIRLFLYADIVCVYI